MPPRRFTGPSKHFVSPNPSPKAPGQRSIAADFMSYLTPFAEGGTIKPVEEVTWEPPKTPLHDPNRVWPSSGGAPAAPAGQKKAPSISARSPVGPKGRAPSAATGLIYKARPGHRKTVTHDFASLDLGPVKDFNNLLTQKDIDDIISRATSIWRGVAEIRFRTDEKAWQEYSRAMKVEWRSDSNGLGALVLSLDGWEASSRELGWAPVAGGMDAGLSKYDGAVHDMRPLILGGKQRKIVPLKLEGSTEYFQDKLLEQARAETPHPFSDDAGRPALPNMPAPKAAKLRKLIESDVQAALATKPGEEVRLTSKGRRVAPSTALTKAGGSTDVAKGRVVYGATRVHPIDSKHSLPYTLTPEGRQVDTVYTRSIFEGAKRVQRDLRGLKNRAVTKKGGTRSVAGTFIVFRTITATGYKWSSSPAYGTAHRRRPGGPVFRTYRGRQEEKIRRQESSSKWFTAGRPPSKLMEAVLDGMRTYIDGLISSRLQSAFDSLTNKALSGSGFATESRSSADAAQNAFVEGFNDLMQKVLAKAFSNTASPKKRRR
jgi:hypothetical protein